LNYAVDGDSCNYSRKQERLRVLRSSGERGTHNLAKQVILVKSLTICKPKATRLYDEAIEGDNVDWGGKELAMVNMTALEKCQTICRELLADPSLPHEHRILLNYYMSAQRDGDLCRFYLKRALSTVEILEAVEGTVDPMREILETQLKEIVESRFLGVGLDRGVVDVSLVVNTPLFVTLLCFHILSPKY
jgi:hypothetical protein